MVCRWTVRGAHRFALNGAQDREKHIEGRYLYDAATRRWLHDFLDMWVGAAAPAAGLKKTPAEAR
jgi:GMP synthase (glutamine-hydrolysing)